MSQKPNYRRGEKRHQDNGPTWEGGPPNSGSNSGHVARGRKDWKDLNERKLRRTGKVKGMITHTTRELPSIEGEDDTDEGEGG